MPSQSTDTRIRNGGFKRVYANGAISVNDHTTAYSSRQKRARLWYVQKPPYEATLHYDDLNTRLVDVTPIREIVFSRSGSSQPWKVAHTHVGYPWIADDAVTHVEKHPPISTDAAMLRCLEAVGEAKWNLALFAAECDKTIDMIASTARTLSGAYKSFRKGNFKKAARTLGINKPKGASASNWLAYRYGWMPLLGDVSSAAEAAASVLYKNPETKRVYCRGPKSETTTTTRYGSSMGGFQHGSGLVPAARDVTFLSRSESKAWLFVECKSSSIMRLEQFGLANPLALAWELVPFSFVADWFIGIGDYLNAQTALLGLSVRAGGVSTLSTRRVKSQRLYPGTTLTATFGGVEPAYTLESRKYQRTPWQGEIPTPRIDVNLNIKRILDSAALIHAVFGKR